MKRLIEVEITENCESEIMRCLTTGREFAPGMTLLKYYNTGITAAMVVEHVKETIIEKCDEIQSRL